jgi:hypothetical protein
MFSLAVDEGGFFFGLATAPAHVEDQLEDAWIEFAKSTPAKKAEKNEDIYEMPHHDEEQSSSGMLEDPGQLVTDSSLSAETTKQNNLIEEKEGISPTFSDEWEVIKENQEMISNDTGEFLQENVSFPSAEEILQKSGSNSIEESLLEFELPKTGKKLAKIAMEAMIRGYQRFVGEDDKTNVAAWHNVYKP